MVNNNWTKIPNEILDNMAEMSNAEFKVVIAIARKTYGWQKSSDKISISQLVRMTGLSHQGVLNAIGKLVNKGIIKKDTSLHVNKYSIELVNLVDISDDDSQLSVPPLVNSVEGKRSKSVNSVEIQKKEETFKEMERAVMKLYSIPEGDNQLQGMLNTAAFLTLKEKTQEFGGDKMLRVIRYYALKSNDIPTAVGRAIDKIDTWHWNDKNKPEQPEQEVRKENGGAYV